MKGTLLKDFGGKDRWLRYDGNALAAFGEKLGLKVRLGSFQEDLFNTPLDLSAITVGVWAGLLRDEPDLTVEQVGSWVEIGHDGNAQQVAQAFFEHFYGTSAAAKEAAQKATGLEDPPTVPAVRQVEVAPV